MNYITRPYNAETDKAFVYSTWLRSLYYSNDFYNQIAKNVFFDRYSAVLDSIIVKSIINIACDSTDNDVILGYAVLQPELRCLHFCYTKPVWRLKGLQSALCGTNRNVCTHLTSMVMDIRLVKHITFNPFLI